MYVPPTQTPSVEVYHCYDPAPCPRVMGAWSIPLQEAIVCVCVCVCVWERESVCGGRGGVLPVEIMLLISQWALLGLTQMEASRKFIMPSWIIPFIAFHKVCVTM